MVFKSAKVSKQDRNKLLAKSGNSVMEQQNKLRQEAALKKKEQQKKAKEEAERLQAEADKKTPAEIKEALDRAQVKLEAAKKLGLNVNRQSTMMAHTKKDYSEYFQADDFDKACDEIKELSAESCLRKVNAKRASTVFKQFVSSRGF